MKTIFLLPPSEGKKTENSYDSEKLSFNFNKPIDIAINATEKDLKCSSTRYDEGISLNKKIDKSQTIEAIKRYSGVMFDAIDFKGMSDKGKYFFNEKFLITSGMYGLVYPQDKIGNYKLPIETKGLYEYWGENILKEIEKLKPDLVVNLLPNSYYKQVFGKTKSQEKKSLENMSFKLININFLKSDLKKISHGVKKIKGQWIKKICENNLTNYEQFGGEVVKNGNIIDINIIKNT